MTAWLHYTLEVELKQSINLPEKAGSSSTGVVSPVLISDAIAFCGDSHSKDKENDSSSSSPPPIVAIALTVPGSEASKRPLESTAESVPAIRSVADLSDNKPDGAPIEGVQGSIEELASRIPFRSNNSESLFLG